MAKLIEIPSVGLVEFPDDMSDEDIGLTIERDIVPSYSSPETKSPAALPQARTASVAPRDALAKTLEESRLFGSATSAMGQAWDKGIRRKPDGEWDLPFLIQQPENSVVRAIAGATQTLAQKTGARLDSAGPAVDQNAIQKVFSDFQQANNLSDEEVKTAWSDLGIINRKWRSEEKARVLSDGSILPNYGSTEWLDDNKARDIIEGSKASTEAKTNALTNLKSIQEAIASAKLEAWAAASVGTPLESPDDWAARTGRMKDFGTVGFAKDYENAVAKKAGWGTGLVTDFHQGNIKLANTLAGFAGVMGSDAAGKVGAEMSQASSLMAQGSPDTGLIGSGIEEAPSIFTQIALTRGMGAAASGLGASSRTTQIVGGLGAFTTAGAQSAGATYSDQIAQGATPEEARAKALRAGLSTAIITAAFQGMGAGGVERVAAGKSVTDVTLRDLLASGSREQLTKNLRSMAGDVLKSVSGEATEEGLDELTQAFLTADPDTNLADAWDNAIEAAKVGGFIGGVVDVGARSFAGPRDPAEQIADTLATEALPVAPESGTEALKPLDENTDRDLGETPVSPTPEPAPSQEDLPEGMPEAGVQPPSGDAAVAGQEQITPLPIEPTASLPTDTAASAPPEAAAPISPTPAPDGQDTQGTPGQETTPETPQAEAPVEGGPENVEAEGLPRERLKSAFNLTDEQADAAQAMSRALRLSPERVLVEREFEEMVAQDKDTSHLDAILGRLSRERQRLEEAITPKERSFRERQVAQAEKELADEYKFLGIQVPTDAELLAELGQPDKETAETDTRPTERVKETQELLPGIEPTRRRSLSSMRAEVVRKLGDPDITEAAEERLTKLLGRIEGAMTSERQTVPTTPTLLEYAKSKLPASVAAKITDESQVESYRNQWEKDYPSQESAAKVAPEATAVPESATKPKKVAKPEVTPDQKSRDASTAIGKAYPFKGINTGSEEKKFIAKAKAELKKLGVQGWQVDSSVESLKTRNARESGNRIAYVNDRSLYRQLVMDGFLTEPQAAPAEEPVTEQTADGEFFPETGITLLPSDRTKDADYVLYVTKGQNYHTLWGGFRNKRGKVVYSYLTILSQDADEAVEKADAYARQMASGEKLSVAFSGRYKESAEGAKSLAVANGIFEKGRLPDIEKAPATPIGDQKLGVGRDSEVLVKDLWEKAPGTANWVISQGYTARMKEIAAYLKKDPSYLEAQDERELERARVEAYEKRRAERDKGKDVPITTLVRRDGEIVELDESGPAPASKPKVKGRKAKDQVVDLVAPQETPSLVDPKLAPLMFPMQVTGANAAITSMDNNGVFLNGDGAGVGKTRQILAVAAHYAAQGKKVFIITENAAIGKPWEKKSKPMLGGSMAKDSEAMGVKIGLLGESDADILVSTYHRVKDSDIPKGAILIFDESQNLANTFGSNPDERNKETREWETKFRAMLPRAEAVAYYSATPADKPHQLAYLHAVLGFTTPEAYLAAAQKAGMAVKSRKFGNTVQQYFDVPKGAAKTKLYKWVNGRMTEAGEQGRFIKREISYEGTDVQFIDVAGTEPVKNPWAEKFQDVLDIMQRAQERGLRLLAPESYVLYAAELTKIGDAVNLAKREIAAGRKVVLYFSRIREMQIKARLVERGMNGELIYHDPEVVGVMPSPVDLLKKELEKGGIPFAELHGQSGSTSQKAQKEFETKVSVLLASVESGGTGINLDDTVGDNPRTEIFMFAPYRGISTVQAMGRIWRASTIQDDTNPNRYVMIVASDIKADAFRSAVLAKKLQIMNAAIGGTAVARMPMSKTSYNPEQLKGLEIPEDGEENRLERPKTGILRPIKVDWRQAKSGNYWSPASADVLEWEERGGPERAGIDVRVFKGDSGWVVLADQPYKPDEFVPAGEPEPDPAPPPTTPETPVSETAAAVPEVAEPLTRDNLVARGEAAGYTFRPQQLKAIRENRNMAIQSLITMVKRLEKQKSPVEKAAPEPASTGASSIVGTRAYPEGTRNIAAGLDAAKKNLPNHIRVYRLGDFFEVFEDQAPLLGTAITKRNGVPMAGTIAFSETPLQDMANREGKPVAVINQGEVVGEIIPQQKDTQDTATDSASKSTFSSTGTRTKIGDTQVGDTVRFKNVPNVVYEVTSTAPARLRVVENVNGPTALPVGTRVSAAKSQFVEVVGRVETKNQPVAVTADTPEADQGLTSSPTEVQSSVGEPLPTSLKAIYPALEFEIKKEPVGVGNTSEWVLRETRTGVKVSSGKKKADAENQAIHALVWQQGWNEKYSSVYEMVDDMIVRNNLDAKPYGIRDVFKPTQGQMRTLLEERLVEVEQAADSYERNQRSVGGYGRDNFNRDFAESIRKRLAEMDASTERFQSPTSDSARHAELEEKFNAGTITDAEMAEAREIVEKRAREMGKTVLGEIKPETRAILEQPVGADGDSVIESSDAFHDAIRQIGLDPNWTAGTSGSHYYEVRPRGQWSDEEMTTIPWEGETFSVRISGHERQLSGIINHAAPDFDTAVHGTPMVALERIVDFFQGETDNNGREFVFPLLEPFTGTPLDQRFDTGSSDIRFQSRPQGAKGSAQLLPDERVMLTAFEKADFTTAVHEMMHGMEMTGFAPLTDEEVATIKKWAGSKTEGRKMMETKPSEKLARGWERYLAEGKAPLAEMQALFDKIAKWMLEVYGSITNKEINVDISPEVRAIFDRLASRMRENTQRETEEQNYGSNTTRILVTDDAASSTEGRGQPSSREAVAGEQLYDTSGGRNAGNEGGDPKVQRPQTLPVRLGESDTTASDFKPNWTTPEQEPSQSQKPEEPDEDVIALRKAWTDAYREAQGLMKSGVKVSQTDQEALNAASERIADHAEWETKMQNGETVGEEPLVGQGLIAELTTNPRVTDKTEKALLLHELMLKDREVTKARNKAQSLPEDASVVSKSEAENQVTRALEDLTLVLDTIKLTNSMSGLALQAAKLVVNRQYDLAQMRADRLRWLNGKEKAPTPAEVSSAMDEVDAMHQKIKAATERADKAEQKLRDYQSKVDEEAIIRKMQQEEKLREAYERGKADAEAKTTKAREAKVKRTETREERQARLDARAEAAKVRLRKRLGFASSGVDPTILADLADLGASYLLKAELTFEEFIDQLVVDLGEKIRNLKVDQLRKVYEDSLAIVAEEEYAEEQDKRVSKKIKTPDELLKKLDPETVREKGLNGNAIYQMARFYVQQGLRGREVIDAVTAKVQEMLPGITRDEVSDAFTGYGRPIFPSNEKDLEVLGHLRNAERIQRQIEDIQAGRMPKKTGIQRRTPDQITRELTKQRNAALKAAGFSHAQSPEALSGYLDSVERRLKNQIEDLDKALETNVPLPGKGKVDYANASNEVKQQLARNDALRKQRDGLKKIYDSVFPPQKKIVTEADKLAALERALDKEIKIEEELAAAGILERRTPDRTQLTPELQIKRNYLDQLKAVRKEAYATKNADEIERKRDAKLVKDSRKRTATIRTRIKNNDYDKHVKTPKPMSRELMEARHDELMAKQEWSRLRGAKLLSNLGWGGKTWHYTKSAISLLRILKLGLELGVGGRQLWGFTMKGIMQPKTFFDVMKKTGAATFSRAEELELWNQFNDPKTNPDSLFYKRDGIVLHGPHSEHTGFKEDIPDPELLERMAELKGKLKALGYPAEFILATERFTRVFINAVRVAEYRKYASMMRGGLPTPEEGKVIGFAVMNSTGRYSFNTSWLESGVAWSNMFTISTRWALSRLAIMTFLPVWGPRGGYRGTGRARAVAAMEIYLKPAAAYIMLTQLLSLVIGGAGDDDDDKRADGTWIDTSPGSTYGTLYVKGRKVDFIGGLRPYITLFRNLGDYWWMDGINNDTGRKINAHYMVQGFRDNRRNPLYAAIYDTALKEQYYGKKEKTPGNIAAQFALPIIFQDTYNLYSTEDPATATLLFLMLQAGASINTNQIDPDAINQRQFDR